MFIVSNDRGTVVNADNVTNIFTVNGNRIVARMVDSEEVIIGEYKEKAEIVFKEMLKNVFPPDPIIFKNCTQDKERLSEFADKMDLETIIISDDANRSEVKRYDCGVYYMPEE